MGEGTMWEYMVWRGQDSRGGEVCRGCGWEKGNAQHAEKGKGFEKRTGIKMERGWMLGLAGRMDEELLEMIKKKGEGREDRQKERERRGRRPETSQGN